MDKMIVDGFQFASGRDAKHAIKEKNAMDKLKDSIDISDTASVYSAYNKLVSKNYFVTPVGLAFLNEMRGYLLQFYTEQELKPVNVPSRVNQEDDMQLLKHSSDRVSKLEKDNDKLRKTVRNLTIAVVTMTILIIGMIFIVVANENLGYFNAEEKILNKYSAWQERLEGWEEELIQREELLEK